MHVTFLLHFLYLDNNGGALAQRGGRLILATKAFLSLSNEIELKFCILHFYFRIQIHYLRLHLRKERHALTHQIMLRYVNLMWPMVIIICLHLNDTWQGLLLNMSIKYTCITLRFDYVQTLHIGNVFGPTFGLRKS
jgi:hypothetical protein